MNTATKKYKVTILGEPYTLVSDEAEDLVLRSAQLVDSCARSLGDLSRITDYKQVAVLAALKLASDLLHLEAKMAADATKYKMLVDLIDHLIVQE